MTVPATSGKKTLIADGLTVSRGVLSLILLFLPVRAPLFTAVYLLCGVSDVLDGFVARALHTESKRGALLDSTADLIFFAVCAVKIFPRLSLPLWVWGWVIGIAAVKLAVILWDRRRKRTLSIPHSLTNRITGVLLFLFPLSTQILDAAYGAAFVCAAATLSAIADLRRILVK